MAVHLAVAAATAAPSVAPAVSTTAAATTGQAAASVAALTWGQAITLTIIVAAAVLAAGAIVAYSRSKTPNATVIRSWLAIALVIGLLLFSAASFALADSTLRSTLIGALTASTGSAVAYYFSTKSSEQARQDLLTATGGSEVVPDLQRLTLADATTALGRTFLKLEVQPTSPTAGTVSTQEPAAGSSVPKGTTVHVTLV